MQNTRSKQIKMIHAAGRTVFADSEERKEWQLRMVGEESCANMTDEQIKVIADAIRKMTQPKNSDLSLWPIDTQTKTWRRSQIKKIVAQWNDLANKGQVRDRSLESCRRYCEKQTHVAKLEWCDKNQLSQIIESLKSWQKRAG